MTESGHLFDEAVRATSAFGELQTDLATVKADVHDMKSDVRHIRTTIDRYAGAMVLVGSLVSIAVTLIVALFR